MGGGLTIVLGLAVELGLVLVERAGALPSLGKMKLDGLVGGREVIGCVGVG